VKSGVDPNAMPGGGIEDRQVLASGEDRVEEEVAFIAAEFRRGFEAVEAIGRPAVTVFGSARVGENTDEYASARRCGALLVKDGFAVVTGGGPGVMEAANRGCREAGGLSIGFNIQLPHEQHINPYVDRSLDFKHFFARKVMLVKAAEAFVIYPGGFGTMDELFESLTLIQTGKVGHFPVVLVGRAYWDPMMRWVTRSMVGRYVQSGDLDLLSVVDAPEEAVAQVVACFRRECAHDLGAVRAVG